MRFYNGSKREGKEDFLTNDYLFKIFTNSPKLMKYIPVVKLDNNFDGFKRSFLFSVLIYKYFQILHEADEPLWESLKEKENNLLNIRLNKINEASDPNFNIFKDMNKKDYKVSEEFK